jgi:hypothetical protein
MTRSLALFALAALLVGCARYTSRGQAPYQYAKQPLPSPYAGAPVTPQAAAVRTPTAEMDDARLVPPRPPQAGAGFAVTPPQPPQPPAVPEPAGITPAAAVQPASAPAKPPSPAAMNLAALKKISGTAAAKWESVTTYEARLVRRETMTGQKDGPTEEVLFQYRKEPHSVYMKNTGQTGKGREVLYVKGKYGDKMTIITGAGDGITGWRTTKSPDDPLVTSRSRHSIRDAGFGKGVAQFAELVAKIEAGKAPPDALKHLGPVQRPEYPYPLECVEQAIKPNDEKHSPAGGTRKLFFDPNQESPSWGLPVLVITTEPNGREVEYYCFDKFKLPANLTDADFDPARFDKKKR